MIIWSNYCAKVGNITFKLEKPLICNTDLALKLSCYSYLGFYTQPGMMGWSNIAVKWKAATLMMYLVCSELLTQIFLPVRSGWWEGLSCILSSAGNTALTYACAGGFVDVVKVLLKAGANIEDHNENGHTPLMEAASAGHVEVARVLLEYGAGINTHSNEFKESALTLACYKGIVSCIVLYFCLNCLLGFIWLKLPVILGISS